MKKQSTAAVMSLLATILLSWDAFGHRQEQGRGLSIKVGATVEETRGGRKVQLWGLVIGVSRYHLGDQLAGGAKIPNLQYAASDAQAVYDFLRSPEGGGFVPESDGGHLILLTDDQATKGNVESALQKLKGSHPDDYFVIYIAAHGSNVPIQNPETRKTEQVPMFFLFDSDPGDPGNTGLRMQMFQDTLKHIPAKRGLVLSDTCHSAGVQLAGRGLHVVDTQQANGALMEAMRGFEGVGFISAAEQTELSYEFDGLSHGAFTYCLLEGFRGSADADRDGMVTFSEIRTYLRVEVPKLTDDKQHPFANATTIETNAIPLAIVRYPGIAANTGNGTTGVLVVRTPDIDGVALSIDGLVFDTLTSKSERTLSVPSGTRTLTFSKGSVRQSCRAVVLPGKSKLVEVNLAFTKDDTEDLDGPNNAQLDVFLDESREPSTEVTELYQKGVDNFNKQRFEESIGYLSRAFQTSGGSYADALVYLGRAQQSLGRNDAAVKSFEGVLKIRPSDYQARILLAEARFRSGANLEEVSQELQSIIRSHPNDSLARTIYADVLLKQIARLSYANDSLKRKYFIEAEKNARHAIRIKPLSPPAYIVLAEVLTHQNAKTKQREAVDAAERAITLLDQLSQKQRSVAKGLSRLSFSHIVFGGGRYINSAATAEAHYLAAKSLNNLCNGADAPADSGALLDRGLAHVQEALKLAQSTRDNVRLMLVTDVSAKINYLKGNDGAAIKDAERAIQTIESTPELKIRGYADPYYILSLAYENQQKFGKAFEFLGKYIEMARSSLSPDDLVAEEDRLRRLKREKEANRQ